MAARAVARPRAIPKIARLVLAVVAALATTTAFLALATAYNAAGKWTHPRRRVPTTTPAAYGLLYEDVRLTTEDGLSLAAWYVPSRSGAAIVLLHGIDSNRAGDLALAADLHVRGYGLLIPDLRAHGESEGSVSTLGLNEVRDVRAAVDYLKRRPDVDPQRIGVHGGSMGASVAIMSAAEIPELRAVVATSGFASVEWVVRNQFEKLESVPGWLAPLIVGMGSWQAGIDVKDIAPVQRVGRISPRPIAIIHGQLDETFSVDNASLLYQAAGEPKQLWIVPGAGHEVPLGPYAANPQAYVERVAGFFDRELAAPDGKQVVKGVTWQRKTV